MNIVEQVRTRAPKQFHYPSSSKQKVQAAFSPKNYVLTLSTSPPSNVSYSSTTPDANIPFINQSFDIFQKLQKNLLTPLTACQQYMSALRALNAPEDLHSILHLIEILYLKTNTSLPTQLLNWNNQNFPLSELSKSVLPSSPDFWGFLKKAIVRGQFTLALSLLSKIPSGDTLRHLLKDMPKSTSFSRLEFDGKWEEWRHACRLKLNSFGDDEESEIWRLLLGILLGKPEDIKQVTKGEWKETLAAYLIYNYPAATYTDINDVLSELNDYIVTPTPENSDLLNQVLFSFVINELNQAIRICARLDWWLVSHLTDLLGKADVLDNEMFTLLDNDNSKTSCRLHEWFLLNYADTLRNSSEDLWKISFEYFTYCPTQGIYWIKEFITRLPLTSPTKTQKVLNFAQSNNLFVEHAAICRILGFKELKSGAIGNSIVHFHEAREYKMVDKISDDLFLTYVKTHGKPNETLNILDSVPKSILYSPLHKRLNFLAQYRNFHNQVNMKERAALLTLLFSSGLAPRGYWGTLLLDAVPLLEADVETFSLEETFELMRCLEEVFASHRSREYLELLRGDIMDVEGEAIGKELEAVRFALTRNLARMMCVSR